MPRRNGGRQPTKPDNLEQLFAEAEALQRASDQREREKRRRFLQPSRYERWVSAVIDVSRDPTNERGETPSIPEACGLQAQAWHTLGTLLCEPGFKDVAQRVEQLALNHDEARNAAVELFHDAARGTSIDELLRRVAAFAGRKEQCGYRRHVPALAEEVWSGKLPCTLPVPEDDSADQPRATMEQSPTDPAARTSCLPAPAPETDDAYVTAKQAVSLTAMSYPQLSKLCKLGGPVRFKRPSLRRLLVHLVDLTRYLAARDSLGK